MIKIICALDNQRIIGHQGKMPWHFPEDLQHFKEITLGHTVLMGRKTYESIGKPLSGRTNIVLSRNVHFQPKGCIVFSTLAQALEFTKNEDVFIIGGQSLFEQTLPLADELYLTEINDSFLGDTYFPEFNPNHYHKQLLKTTTTPFDAQFCLYRRKSQHL